MHSKERFQNNYDFLRLFAAFSIIFYHSFSLLAKPHEDPLYQLTNGQINFSFVGLCIFFSISGYLIAKSAARSPTILNYLWKRLLRIQPLLVIICLFTTISAAFFSIFPFKIYFTNPSTWSYFRNIMPVFGIQFTLPGVFIHNVGESGVNGSLWTLIVEERLYLFMCIVFLLRKKFSSYFVWFIIIPNIFYLINRFFFYSEIIPYFNTSAFFYALIFLNSAALYFLKIKFDRSLRLYIALSFFVFIIAVIFPTLNFLYFYSIPVLINSVAKIKGVTNYAGKYGDFTYAIYVFSFPIQQMFISSSIIKPNPYLLFCFTLLIVFPFSILSWNLVEKRFLKLKKKVGMHTKI